MVRVHSFGRFLDPFPFVGEKLLVCHHPEAVHKHHQRRELEHVDAVDG